MIHEITVGFLTMAIDNKDFIDILPKTAIFLAQFSFVEICILDLKSSHRFLFPNSAAHIHFVVQTILVIKHACFTSFLKLPINTLFGIWKFYSTFPRDGIVSIFNSHPFFFGLSFFHADSLNLGFWTGQNHLIFRILYLIWIWKCYKKCLPFEIKLTAFDIS